MDAKLIAMKLLDLFQSLGPGEAYALILGVLFACSMGLPIPEDITLITAGILASLGTISFPGAMIAGFVGVLVGDGILFFLGRRFGPRVYSFPLFRRLWTPERIANAEARIRKHGKLICFMARFMPGLRAPIYLTAGTMGVKPIVFILADGIAALISVPVWIYAGYWFGSNIDGVLAFAKKMNTGILSVLGVAILGYILYFKVWKPRKMSSVRK